MARLDPYTPTPAARASRVVVMVLPFVIGIACVLLSFVPVGRIFGSSNMPAFALMAIFYWAVVRPDMFPVYAVFVVGLLTDLLSAGPIGLWAFTYVLTYTIVLTQRFLIINVPFSVFWIAFLLAGFIAGTISWSIASVIYGALLPVRPVLTHVLITAAVFPLFAFLFGRIERRILPSG
ncbi:MAG: rod shape-determining protein MreD [Parvibaculum sp.]|nr:rod shape-determining protein MreD [Parvibaculum sp.]|tara:strand:+ start:1101 stop:1634 length:534 start_codon:yes stop_codon:yes gene_type:complete